MRLKNSNRLENIKYSNTVSTGRWLWCTELRNIATLKRIVKTKNNATMEVYMRYKGINSSHQGNLLYNSNKEDIND